MHGRHVVHLFAIAQQDGVRVHDLVLGSPVLVNLEEDTRACAGAVGISKGYGLGAAVAYNEIDIAVAARLDGSSLQTSSALTLLADSSAEIETIAVGVGGGKSLGLAGSVSFNDIENSTEARISSLSTRESPIRGPASATMSVIGWPASSDGHA